MLGSEETELIGRWNTERGEIIADPVCDRISALISDHLIEIGKCQSGWNTLFRDPVDGRLWERVYPQAELHGGGPPTLRVVDASKAQLDYGL